jgi:GTP-binding protein
MTSSQSPVAGRPPSVAIVGRPNVGKSTLVNRLFGRRETISHDEPGVTRDRIELETTWAGKRLGLVDTAGYSAGARGIEGMAREQTDIALAQADAIVLVVDASAGVTEADAALARQLRRAAVPVVVAANKVDTHLDEADAAAFHALGLGDPITVSGLHGRGTSDLLDRLVFLLPDAPRAGGSEASPEPRFAVVGRPNVGKSSLFNQLVGQERSIVSEISGTTRDAVDQVVSWPDGPVRFVDTAGMRRKIRVQGVERFSFARAMDAVERASVVTLVIDAEQGFTVEDRKIAARIIDAGRALVFVANKWDLIEHKDDLYQRLALEADPFARAVVMRTSAKSGRGVQRLPPVLLDLHQRWMSRVPTSRVNSILSATQREQPTPRDTGTLHYATQVSTSPPTFVIFGGLHQPGPSYRRFLENRFRRELALDGVPVRLRFRGRRRRSGD